jgi:hypothetical protein
LVLTAGLVLAGLSSAPAAAASDIGYLDQAYVGSSPTGTKPESKLWWNDGVWWADMATATKGAFHIFKLDPATQSWIDTGTPLDTRKNSRADCLWDPSQQKLYVASHLRAADSNQSLTGKPAKLYRLSYDSVTKKYTLDPGFPVAINDVSSETLVIDKDSTGKLWATWTRLSQVYVNATTTDDMHWGSPFVPDVPGTSNAPDDISSVISFGPGQIGLMWSNQLTPAMYFAVHLDGDPAGTWQASRAAVQGPKMADDHISLQTDSSGRVFAAVKTSATKSTAALINLLVRDPVSGGWTAYVFGRVADHHTRPIVVLDQEHGVIHMFATGPTPPNISGIGTIYEKTSPTDTIAFPVGLGTPVIQAAADLGIDNAASTKQNVNSTTGLVILASSDATKRYYHASIVIAP